MSGVQLENTTETIYKVHPPDACAGARCPIHNLTDHHMRSFPQHWRGDKSEMERICPHGVGHPDPDDLFAHDVHGCDGCCHPNSQEGWCFYHDEVEPIGENDIVCFECKHRYKGVADIIATNNLIWHENRPPNEAIFSCPYCVHDF